jgi:hypothetical protein
MESKPITIGLALILILIEFTITGHNVSQKAYGQSSRGAARNGELSQNQPHLVWRGLSK